VLGEATANDEASMNAASAAGKTFLRRSINGDEPENPHQGSSNSTGC
jgi:hypothetical protein